MERRRIDEVRVALRQGMVVLPWTSRDALLERVGKAGTMNDVVDAFRAVRTTQPVRLTDAQKAEMLNVISFWADKLDGGYNELPEGIDDLRNALRDDLHRVGIEATND
jgi:hypothetical protein